MPERRGWFELHGVHLSRVHAWLLAGTSAVLLGTGALAATASTTGRHALLAQLQRAATSTPSRGSAGFQVARVSPAGRSVDLAMVPNRVAVSNRLSVRLTDHGRPVSAARVAIAFSMPSMNMSNAYVAVLRPEEAGSYTTIVPVLGMVGSWELRVLVAPHRGSTFHVSVIDRIAS
jgi:YtkA-like